MRCWIHNKSNFIPQCWTKGSSIVEVCFKLIQILNHFSKDMFDVGHFFFHFLLLFWIDVEIQEGSRIELCLVWSCWISKRRQKLIRKRFLNDGRKVLENQEFGINQGKGESSSQQVVESFVRVRTGDLPKITLILPSSVISSFGFMDIPTNSNLGCTPNFTHAKS